MGSLVELKRAYEFVMEAKTKKARMHILANGLSEDDWSELYQFIQKITSTLQPLSEPTLLLAHHHIDNLQTAIRALAPEADWSLPENQIYQGFIDEVKEEAERLAPMPFSQFAAILRPLLREQKRGGQASTHARLAIYGVLEARLMPTDILIMGGLNEGRWPAQPEANPWLNRTMRKIFGMQQPEKDIGIAAHDFTQAFGYEKLYLTWSKKLDGSPQIPSRWILRLQTILQGSGIDKLVLHDADVITLARALDQAEKLSPCSMPKPLPDIKNRPTQLSVTEIEKLVRDPYSMYAKKILKLEPLPDMGREPDAALRGTLYHQAIATWNEQQSEVIHAGGLRVLIQAIESAMQGLAQNPEIALFWLARFRRIARWLVNEEPNLRNNTLRVEFELSGRIEFSIDSQNYVLTARADRIDHLNDGTAQIIDYKSGEPPTGPIVVSGFSPQLPLEAAILSQGGFQKLPKLKTSQLKYVQISGRNPEGKIIEIKNNDGATIDDLADKHLEGLKQLLRRFSQPSHPYIPRLALKTQDEDADFDHLSRHKEWLLAGI